MESMLDGFRWTRFGIFLLSHEKIIFFEIENIFLLVIFKDDTGQMLKSLT